MGPSSGLRSRRARPRQRRARNTSTASERPTLWGAKMETGLVAAMAAMRPSCSRSRRPSLGFHARALLAVDRGFLGQHDRDVVADRVHALALTATEARAVLHDLHRRLAHRAGQ